ncbi:putative dual-specificity RNA methyltransferase RlmN [subsurface metagenome]
MGKNDIRNLTLEELKKTVVEMHEARYRANQIFSWFYRRGVHDFHEMDNIPVTLRDKLGENYYISALELSQHLKSTDGTEKFLFKLADGNFIESVLIYAKNRKTICLSTQVGCKFACSFCTSGFIGFIRNLTPAEITNQILFLQHNLKHKITNYVLMGMGEPLDNYENVCKAIMIMNDPEGMAIGARRITISTCGIIPGMKKLQDLSLQVNLSVSLHATNNNLRDALMPINKRYPLEKLIKACQDLIDATGRMITIEYILIKDKNDSLEDADKLAAIAKKLKAKVNLVPYSTIPTLNFQSTGRKETNIFMNRLVNKRVNATLRESKGKDIQAACGQLAGRAKE